MAISVEQYRAAIGLFNLHGSIKHLKAELYFWSFIFLNFVFCHLFLPSIILLSGDISENPGPQSAPQTKNIEIGHANVRSLTAKIDDPSNPSMKICKFSLVKNHILYYNYDIFGISETWLDSTVLDSDLSIPGYWTPFRRDVSRHQCGTMVYVSKTLPAKRRLDIEPKDAEIVCVEVQVAGRKILVNNCYRAPHFDVVDFCSAATGVIDDYSNEFEEIIFLGDMNGRNVLFWNGDKTNTEGRALYASFNSLGFDNMIHEPTRIVGDTKSCIDLLFTNNPFMFSKIGVREKIVEICDHCPIFATMEYNYARPQCYKRWVWNFDKGDYDKFRTMLLNAPWEICYDGRNVDSTVKKWMTLLLMVSEACIPHYQATIRPSDKDFMNSDLRKLMRQRDRLKDTYKETNDETVGDEFRRCRNLVVSECRKADVETKLKKDDAISQTEISSKKWWKILKESLSSATPGADGPISDNGFITTDNVRKVDLFNLFFASQSTLDESQAVLPNERPIDSRLKIAQLVVQPEDLYKVLSKLDPSKATGPDGIGNRILKEAAVPLAQPLSNLLNYCLSLGSFPDIWKIANVIPLYKKDDPLLCNNYRPMSLLPCISKVFEKVLFNHIFTFLRHNRLVKRNQSGFTPGDSTINQLIAMCNELYQCVDEGDEMVAVFLDLSKAFDKVWHKGLLYKIEHIGVCGKLLDLVTSYLSNRKQMVSISGCTSSLTNLKAGVPQGSVLGPLLFLIYINDISDDLKSNSFLFADDTSIFQRVYKGNIARAVALINQDLCTINDWAKQWLVTINAKKTVAMLFSKKRTPSVMLPVFIGGTNLIVVDEHKQLGILFSKDLSWTSHIKQTTAKCNRLLGMLSKNKYIWSRLSLEVCYKSFIRPILEYGNMIYDCCTIADSEEIESVQLSAARLVTGAKRGTSHGALYRELGWTLLKTRREISKLTKLYCIINNLTPTYLHELIQPLILSHNHRTRSQASNNFNIAKCNTVLFQNSFVNSTVKLWNKLDQSVKCAPTKASFKTKLVKLHCTTPLLFNHETSRPTQVAFMQIRLGFSNLRYDLFNKGCIDDGMCQCGCSNEDAAHYFLKCSQYDEIRKDMLTGLSGFNIPAMAKLSNFLYGSKKLTTIENLKLFQIIYKYIDKSKRFKHV